MAMRRRVAKQLTDSLASPQPFRKVLEPAPELPIRARLAALRHCCPEASESALRRVAKDKGSALLAALRLVLPTGHTRFTAAALGGKRPAAAAGSAQTAAKRQQLGLEEQLGPMLAEAAHAEDEQERFLAAQQAAGPESGTRQKSRGSRPKHAGFPASLRCCACMEEGPPSSLVPCSFALQKIEYAKRAAKTWAKAAVPVRSGRRRTAPSRKVRVAERLREVAKEVEPHVFCASCLRTYLMGTTVHAGNLRKMFCPGCTKTLRDSAEVAHGGWHWCQECREFHYSNDEFDMTGLGLDGIRTETGHLHLQPLAPDRKSVV